MAIAFKWPVDRVSIRREGKHAGICEFRVRAGAPPAEIASVYLAGFLAERFVAPDANVEAANTDISRALPHVAVLSVKLEDLVLRVRQRLVNMWPEVDRLAEALDMAGELDAGGILRAIRTPAEWLEG